VQDKFFGGGNHIWLQYAEGSTDINQGISDNGAHGSGYKVWRIVESPSWQVGAFGGQAIAMYQHNEAPAGVGDGGNSNYWTIGGRGSWGLTKNLKWLTEIGYSSLKPDGGKNENVTKVTIGPALSTGPDFWKRPELRLYVTYADYNKAAAQDTANNYGFPANKTSAVSYGAQSRSGSDPREGSTPLSALARHLVRVAEAPPAAAGSSRRAIACVATPARST
jgi:maltoporin